MRTSFIQTHSRFGLRSHDGIDGSIFRIGLLSRVPDQRSVASLSIMGLLRNVHASALEYDHVALGEREDRERDRLVIVDRRPAFVHFDVRSRLVRRSPDAEFGSGLKLRLSSW